MAKKSITGLTIRYGQWHIDKQIKGYGRLCESTGTDDREEAEKYLVFRLEEIRKASIYGTRPTRTWREAATKYLVENQDMPSIELTATMFKRLDDFIGDLRLDRIHDLTLAPFIDHRLKVDEVSNRTVNIALERIIRVLRLASLKWRDEYGITWLDKVPMITKLDEKKTRRPPYPLSMKEQEYLFKELPAHLQAMMLFKVNAGCREQEVCKLCWSWEVKLPEINTSIFLIPDNFGGRTKKSGVKNGEDRILVLNDVAKSVIDRQRGLHSEYVFPYQNGCLSRMNASSWQKARKRAAINYAKDQKEDVSEGFYNVRVHDLKHTFGRRLRAAGVSNEDRQFLLGHTNGNVTTHYSAVEIENIINEANKILINVSRETPALTLIKRKKKLFCVG